MRRPLLRLAGLLLGVAAAGGAPQQPAQAPAPAPMPAQAPAPAKFQRGAKPSPRFKLQAATPFRPVKAAPAQFAIVPPKLSYWYNDTYGICVTAQEAVSKAAWSIQCGLPELFVPDAEVLRWATKYGFRDGADLAEVMDQMQRDGFTVGGTNYKDGPYYGVDYSNESTLQAAIATGPVNIAIDADALPSGAGNQSGWYATGKGRFPNTDHCVALLGYGPAEFLFKALGLSCPAALVGKSGYLLFTWNTIGFVDHAWLMGTCAEAWVRNPTTPGQSPPPTPDPTPTPTPNPGGGYTLTIPPGLPPGNYTVGGGSVLTPEEAAMLQALVAKVTGPQPAPEPDPEPTDGWVDDAQVLAAVAKGMKQQGASDAALAKLMGKPFVSKAVLRLVFRKMARDPEGAKLLAQYKSGALPASWLTDFLDWFIKNGPALLQLILQIISLFG